MIYLQYFSDQEFPLFIALDEEKWDTSFVSFLQDLQFQKREKEDLKKFEARPDYKLLTLHHTQAQTSREIGQYRESDQFGPESFYPYKSHKLYRYQGVALLYYALSVSEWSLHLSQDQFEKNNFYPYRVIVHRFIALALASRGVVGVWGSLVNEGIVLQRSQESNGHSIFIDIINNKIYSSREGALEWNEYSHFIRLDKFQGNFIKRLSKEELFGYLSVHMIFMDIQGPIVPLRQALHVICKNALASVYAEENFIEDSGLSLS